METSASPGSTARPRRVAGLRRSDAGARHPGDIRLPLRRPRRPLHGRGHRPVRPRRSRLRRPAARLRPGVRTLPHAAPERRHQQVEHALRGHGRGGRPLRGRHALEPCLQRGHDGLPVVARDLPERHGRDMPQERRRRGQRQPARAACDRARQHERIRRAQRHGAGVLPGRPHCRRPSPRTRRSWCVSAPS
jgi:hypothetical protein